MVVTVSLVLGSSSVATGESDGRRKASLLVLVLLRRVGRSSGTGGRAGVAVVVVMMSLAEGLGI